VNVPSDGSVEDGDERPQRVDREARLLEVARLLSELR
jgi:hypothetical protein